MYVDGTYQLPRLDVAPPGLLGLFENRVTRALRPWLHDVAPPGLGWAIQFFSSTVEASLLLHFELRVDHIVFAGAD